jgi:hypothetical protein
MKWKWKIIGGAIFLLLILIGATAVPTTNINPSKNNKTVFTTDKDMVTFGNWNITITGLPKSGTYSAMIEDNNKDRDVVIQGNTYTIVSDVFILQREVFHNLTCQDHVERYDGTDEIINYDCSYSENVTVKPQFSEVKIITETRPNAILNCKDYNIDTKKCPKWEVTHWNFTVKAITSGIGEKAKTIYITTYTPEHFSATAGGVGVAPSQAYLYIYDGTEGGKSKKAYLGNNITYYAEYYNISDHTEITGHCFIQFHNETDTSAWFSMTNESTGSGKCDYGSDIGCHLFNTSDYNTNRTLGGFGTGIYNFTVNCTHESTPDFDDLQATDSYIAGIEPLTACGQTLTHAGWYYFVSDLSTGGSTCITVGGSDIDIDQRAYTMSSSTGTGYQFNSASGTNLSIRGGNFSASGNAKYVNTDTGSVGGCDDLTIYNVSDVKSTDPPCLIQIDEGCHLTMYDVGDRANEWGLRTVGTGASWAVNILSSYYNGYIDSVNNTVFVHRNKLGYAIIDNSAVSGDNQYNNIYIRMNEPNGQNTRGISHIDLGRVVNLTCNMTDMANTNSRTSYCIFANGGNTEWHNSTCEWNDAGWGNGYCWYITAVNNRLYNVDTRVPADVNYEMRGFAINGAGKTYIENVTCTLRHSGTKDPSKGSYCLAIYGGATATIINNTGYPTARFFTWNQLNSDGGATCLISGNSVNNQLWDVNCTDTSNNGLYAMQIGTTDNTKIYNSFFYSNRQNDLYVSGTGTNYLINQSLNDGWGDYTIAAGSDARVYKQWWSGFGVNNTKYDLMIQNALIVAVSLNESYQENIAYGLTSGNGYSKTLPLTERILDETGENTTFFSVMAANPETGELNMFNISDNGRYIINMTLTLQPMPETHCAGNQTDTWFSFVFLDSKGDLLVGLPTAYLNMSNGTSVFNGIMRLDHNHYIINTSLVNGTGNYIWYAELSGGQTYPCTFTISSGGTADVNTIDIAEEVWGYNFTSNLTAMQTIEQDGLGILPLAVLVVAGLFFYLAISLEKDFAHLQIFFIFVGVFTVIFGFALMGVVADAAGSANVQHLADSMLTVNIYFGIFLAFYVILMIIKSALEYMGSRKRQPNV